MVFQSYAIWPHMTVFDNVGYPLLIRRRRSAEIREKVTQALRLVEMEDFADRPAPLLSGGQQQRVAIARALVFEPEVLLLDEPLSNLDAKLRTQTGDEFRAIQKRLGITTLYVTHDQAEAMAMADRIAVMEKGRILQVADPVTLYREPASPEVARFIGQGRVDACRPLGPAGDGRREIDLFATRVVVRAGAANGAATGVCLRPEDLAISVNGDASGGFAARVVKSTYKGGYALVELAPEAAPETVLVAQAERLVPRGESVRVAVKDGWLLG
jgi:iron(III) transport system ATP-binding protein